MKRVASLLALFIFNTVAALYDGNADVVQLTSSNFQSKVLNSDSVWIVEFYANWCGHCQAFAPEYAKAAKALKGIVRVGSVDMDQEKSLTSNYKVNSVPVVKVFGQNKQQPVDFQGSRTAQSLVDAALSEVKKAVQVRLTGRSSSSSGSRGGGGSKSSSGSADDVIELTDSNFEETITKSNDMWLVEFYAPWCGHCKNLAPQWASAAAQLKGKVKMAAIDATVHTQMAQRFSIQGFPTIKVFPSGEKRLNDATDYTGGRTASDIVQWIEDQLSEMAPAPEVVQLTDGQQLTACGEHQLCVVAVLSHILDCQSKCRNDYIRTLQDSADRFKKNHWGWIWVEAGAQPALEEALGIGGFGYPAMAAINIRKMKFAILRGSFSKEGIAEFLRDLSYGRGSTSSMKSAEMPAVVKTEPWDGKDGEYPVDEDVDLEQEL